MGGTNTSRSLADLDLSRRLEWTEARSNIAFVEARARISPETGAEWIEVAGAAVMYDGVASPCTQTFGLGMRAHLLEHELERIETFYLERGAPVYHEVSPLADIAVHQLLCRRGYQPVEMTSVMFRDLAAEAGESRPGGPGVGEAEVKVRVVGQEEWPEWARLAAEGWSELAEYADLMYDLAMVTASRTGALSFLAEIAGQGVATAGLSIVDDVALLTGASTIPAARRQGAQRALLNYRLAAAARAGCRLAMICAQPGSASQRNAEREGFRIAYTRIKWGLTGE
ncbi:MAG: GNAT family N-acetyltransferase [Acidobacteriota bacterium]